MTVLFISYHTKIWASSIFSPSSVSNQTSIFSTIFDYLVVLSWVDIFNCHQDTWKVFALASLSWKCIPQVPRDWLSGQHWCSSLWDAADILEEQVWHPANAELKPMWGLQKENCGISIINVFVRQVHQTKACSALFSFLCQMKTIIYNMILTLF